MQIQSVIYISQVAVAMHKHPVASWVISTVGALASDVLVHLFWECKINVSFLVSDKGTWT